MPNTIEAPWVGHPPETTAAEYPRCPVCGSREAETFYFLKPGIMGGDCVGCDRCLIPKDYTDIEKETL